MCDRFGYTLEQVRDFSYSDFKLYQAYIQKEPAGARAQAYYFGQLMALIANVNGTSKKTEPFKVSDFVPWADQTIPDDYLTETELEAKENEEEQKAIDALMSAIT
ncbi:phage tail assembly protein T [Vibrio alginolyticus]